MIWDAGGRRSILGNRKETFGEMNGTTRKSSVTELGGREYQVEKNGEQYKMALKSKRK